MSYNTTATNKLRSKTCVDPPEYGPYGWTDMMRAFLQAVSSARRLLYKHPIEQRKRYTPSFDPYRYTQGRWLDRNQEQQDARVLHFDFDALLDVAIKCSPGARRVTHCDKKDGGFNRVFMIHMDNASTVVARLPTRISGPAKLTVSSEVATLRFVKENTAVPVPTVLAWEADSNNSVGSEYMILDRMPGVPLKDVWSTMSASQHVACIRSIGRLCKELCRLSFPAYGSLYTTSEAPSGSIKLDDDFCIGPLCAPQQWGCSLDSAKATGRSNAHPGPWHDIEDYFADLIGRVKGDWCTGPSQLSSRHLGLLDELQQSLHVLLANEAVIAAGHALLIHADLHTRNILVDLDDHTKVTGIIDWQSAAIEPAFISAASTPDFAEEVLDSEVPVVVTKEEEAHNARVRADVDLCTQAWAVMQQTCDKLRPASRLDDALLRILAAPSFDWISNEVILERLLGDLAKEWTRLGLPGQSAHQPCNDEDTLQRLEDYQSTRRLRNHLTRVLRCDTEGWVSNDRWEDVLQRYRLEYSRFVNPAMDDDESTNEDDPAKAVAIADRLWPWDQR